MAGSCTALRHMATVMATVHACSQPLSCACCLQHFADPVRLRGCGHSFCRPCILQYCKGKQRAACPLCREGFELKDLRPNRELAALVNLVRQEVKEEELEAQNEPKPPAAVACNDESSAGRRHGDKVRTEAARGSSPGHPGTTHGVVNMGTWLRLRVLNLFATHPGCFAFPVLIPALS
uniref:RING-type domain-containing protein n=1 Tax=Amazona collaria TaxID=241587 RepID=A0A8B9FN21_9PSIT